MKRKNFCKFTSTILLFIRDIFIVRCLLTAMLTTSTIKKINTNSMDINGKIKKYAFNKPLKNPKIKELAKNT